MSSWTVHLLCGWGQAGNPGLPAPHTIFFFFSVSISQVLYKKLFVGYLKFKVTLRSCILSGNPMEGTGDFTTSICVYWMGCVTWAVNILTLTAPLDTRPLCFSRNLLIYNYEKQTRKRFNFMWQERERDITEQKFRNPMTKVLAVWPCASNLTALSLDWLIFKM